MRENNIIFKSVKAFFTAIAIVFAAPFNCFAQADANPEMAYRPLVEEYTGLWCTACPAGYVAVEEASDKYGADFVVIAYHLNDEIQSKAVEIPASPKSVPAAYLDRSEISAGVWGIEQAWLDACDYYTGMPVPAEIGVKIEWTSMSRTRLRAKAKVNFTQNHTSAGYRLAYCLVADRLKNPAWGQANRFGGMHYTGKYWDKFTKGGAYVYGLEFNNVPCIYKNPAGMEGSLPKMITAGEEYGHEETFTLAEALTRKGNLPLIKDKDKLRVIAILLDSRGKVINAVSSAYSADAAIAESGVEDIDDAEVKIVKTEYYGLQGERLSAESASRCVCIRVELLEDGSLRSRKIIPRM